MAERGDHPRAHSAPYREGRGVGGEGHCRRHRRLVRARGDQGEGVAVQRPDAPPFRCHFVGAAERRRRSPRRADDFTSSRFRQRRCRRRPRRQPQSFRQPPCLPRRPLPLKEGRTGRPRRSGGGRGAGAGQIPGRAAAPRSLLVWSLQVVAATAALHHNGHGRGGGRSRAGPIYGQEHWRGRPGSAFAQIPCTS